MFEPSDLIHSPLGVTAGVGDPLMGRVAHLATATVAVAVALRADADGAPAATALGAASAMRGSPSTARASRGAFIRPRQTCC